MCPAWDSEKRFQKAISAPSKGYTNMENWYLNTLELRGTAVPKPGFWNLVSPTGGIRDDSPGSPGPALTFALPVLLQAQLHRFHCPGAGEDEPSVAFRTRQLHTKPRGTL